MGDKNYAYFETHICDILMTVMLDEKIDSEKL